MQSRARNQKPVVIQCLLVTLAVLAFSLLTLAARVPPLVAFLMAVNLATVTAYAYDKWAAPREGKRIPENSLHLLAALGGTPAAFASQHLFRHKTRKQTFRLRFWLIVLAQVLLLLAWLWASGRLRI